MQLWLLGDTQGDNVVVWVLGAVAGTYDVSTVQTQARDYGIAQLTIDGSDVGPVDRQLYRASGVGTVELDHGTVDLAAGEHILTPTAVDRNPAAVGYMIGLDVMRLAKEGRPWAVDVGLDADRRGSSPGSTRARSPGRPTPR